MRYKELKLCTVVILGLISNTSDASDKRLDQKQIYELRKDCGQSAVEFSKRYNLCDGKGSYTNHYNINLNTCFIDMKETCSDKHKGKNGKAIFAEQLLDVNENKEYAAYLGPFLEVDGQPISCSVGAKHCKTILEFQQLIKPYMEE